MMETIPANDQLTDAAIVTPPVVSAASGDYDSPWKEAIEQYFPAFIAFFFPDIHTDIAWDRGYEFLDKELERVVRDATIGRRYADKLLETVEPLHVLLQQALTCASIEAFRESMYTV